MAAGTQISLEQYLGTLYRPDCDYVDGELLERNIGEFEHAGLQKLLIRLLEDQSPDRAIRAFPELRAQVAPGRFRVPDVTVIRGKGRGRILTEPPLLCIEILSPEDRASRIEARIDDYLKFGVENVWVIDPEARIAYTYSRDGKRQPTETLRVESPALEIRLPELFAALAEEIEL